MFCIFLQETYEIWDTIKYDNGTLADHNDIWDNLNYMSRGDEYTTLYSSDYTVNRYTSITDDTIIEFDVMTDMGSGGQWGSIRQDNTPLLSLTNNPLNLSADNWHHIKIVVDNGDCTVSNTENSNTITGSVSGVNRLYLRASSNYHTYFKNLRIYSI